LKKLVGYICGRLVLACAALSAAYHGRRAKTPNGKSELERDSDFEIRTFVTDDAQYAEMKATFVAAGFGADSFVRLSDRDSDPYSEIARAGRASARYVILCHQDVRLDHGTGRPELVAAIAELDRLGRNWVVAGNGGVSTSMKLVRRLTDPHGGSTRDRLPARALTLDENFLLLNVENRPRASHGLHGFHFYGADVCLNAIDDGGTAWVIDFPLTHLSGGSFDESYSSLRLQFAAAWGALSFFRYVVTANEVLFLSRFSRLRPVFGSSRVLNWAFGALLSRMDEGWRTNQEFP
jgi:hypothetical protein